MNINFMNRTALFFLFIFLPASGLFAQLLDGGIINLAGDTIVCKIASSPKDAGLKKRTGTYQYDYVAAVFNNDSAAIIYPGNIKGYYIKRINENNTKIYRYFSDSINSRFDMIFKKPILLRPVFLQSLVTGGYYQLWYFEQPDPGARNDRNFILEETHTGRKNHFHSTAHLKKLLGDWPGSNKEDPRYKNWFTGKQWMVIDFNRYRSGK